MGEQSSMQEVLFTGLSPRPLNLRGPSLIIDYYNIICLHLFIICVGLWRTCGGYGDEVC